MTRLGILHETRYAYARRGLPVSGAILGDPGDAHLHVSVQIRLIEDLDAAA
jgi:hypothetical protein